MRKLSGQSREEEKMILVHCMETHFTFDVKLLVRAGPAEEKPSGSAAQERTKLRRESLLCAGAI